MPGRKHEQSICILRQPKELSSVVSVRRQRFTHPTRPTVTQPDLDPYREDVRPLVRSAAVQLGTPSDRNPILGVAWIGDSIDQQDLHHV